MALICQLVSQVLQARKAIQCIKAHQDLDAYPETVKRWAIKGNQSADELANHSLSLAPGEVKVLSQKRRTEVMEQRQLGNFSTKWHTRLPPKRSPSNEIPENTRTVTGKLLRWNGGLTMTRTRHQLIFRKQTRLCRKDILLLNAWELSSNSCLTLKINTPVFHNWIQWVSFHQLFVHFMVATGQIGTIGLYDGGSSSLN